MISVVLTGLEQFAVSVMKGIPWLMLLLIVLVLSSAPHTTP